MKNFVGRVYSGVKGFYSGINSATLTGAIDVVVIEREDGTFVSTPFHVRFGKIGVLRSREKVVDIEVNGNPVSIQMKLGDSGEAFFLQEVNSEDESEEDEPVGNNVDNSSSSTSNQEEGEGNLMVDHRKKRRRRKQREKVQGELKPKAGQVDNVKILDSSTVKFSPDTNYFSDTEVQEAAKSLTHSEAADSVLSDSEYEMQKTTTENEKDEWIWGEIPSASRRNSGITTTILVPSSSGSTVINGQTKSESVKNEEEVLALEEKKYKKSLRLTSTQIESLGLCPGRNEGVFSVTTAFQGTTVARCHIYLWRHDERIVVSDVDGTITKSDVLGQVLPIIGRDWAQSGVAQLFTQIHGNGYNMLYLSARSISQARMTRDYLRSIKQDEISLPDGPLFLNPTSLMSALHKEVIDKTPEEFKIACLRDIQTMFPSNPLYAGFGNRINDVWTYRAVEIPIQRIFTINHRGIVQHALNNTFQSSYSSLLELADFIFPPYKNQTQSQEVDQREKAICQQSSTDNFTSYEFWRDPIPELVQQQSTTTEKT